jgi:hypothetical protein
MHRHIWSFCTQPGCKDADYHPNTEDLVSPPVSDADLKLFGDSDDDMFAIACHENPCPNTQPYWVYIMRGDPLMKLVRPNHWRPDVALEQGPPDTWARGHSMIEVK